MTNNDTCKLQVWCHSFFPHSAVLCLKVEKKDDLSVLQLGVAGRKERSEVSEDREKDS